MATIITGTGSYIPNIVKTNKDFISNTFYGENGELIPTPNQEIVEKFKDITGIYERRYAEKSMNTSEMATVRIGIPNTVDNAHITFLIQVG